MMEMPSKASETRQVSMTAFYVGQLSIPSFWSPSGPKTQTQAERSAAVKARKWIILAYQQGKGEPFNAQEMIEYLDISRSVIRNTLEMMEKEGLLRRVNLNGRVHWTRK
jgi:DNA-binding HxlR family transcriptional regulator